MSDSDRNRPDTEAPDTSVDSATAGAAAESHSAASLSHPTEQTSDSRSSDAESSDSWSSDARSSDARSSDGEPGDGEPVNVRSSGDDPNDVRPTDVHSDDTAAEQPSSARGGPDQLAQVITAAAERAGLRNFADDSVSTGDALLTSIGGVRGIIEAVVPGFLFVLVYVLSNSLPLSLLFSVGAAVVFTIIRLLQRTPFVAALGGLVGVALSAVFALMTGRAEDNFVYGFIVNGVSVGVLVASLLVRWPLIGVIAETLFGDGSNWRERPRTLRFYNWLTIGWAALFLARLAVQLPLWAAGEVAALGITKLIMGLPLYAPALVVTALIVKAWMDRTTAAATAEKSARS